jgi:hypothetical protein
MATQNTEVDASIILPRNKESVYVAVPQIHG